MNNLAPPPLSPIPLGKITAQRVQFYADASGDHNPIHLDAEYAKKAGLDDRIAHGMLTMGLGATCLEKWGFDLAKLKGFEAKFKDKLFLNEELVAHPLAFDAEQSNLEFGFEMKAISASSSEPRLVASLTAKFIS